jgi:L-ascorbate 6-phosphate lactonase
VTATATSLLERFGRLAVESRSAALLWLGQSSFALRISGRTVLVDPFLSPHPDRLVPPPFAAEEARNVDLILITHDHLDHLDDEALPVVATASPEALIVVPAQLVERVVALGIERSRVAGLASDSALESDGVVVHAVPACHGDGPADAYRLGAFLGYVVEGAGVRVYHAGDTIPFPGLVERLRSLRVHLALVPINGRDAARERQGIVGNLDAREAAELTAAAGVDAVLPMHWDMFAANPGDPAELVAAAETMVIVPRRLRPFVYTVCLDSAAQ